MNRCLSKIVGAGILVAVLTCWVVGAEIDYPRDIKPIFKAKCFACHGAIKQEAGLRLDTVAFMRKGGDSGSALELGKETTSLLLERISAKDQSDRMPPEGEPLSGAQLNRVKAWLAQGATAPTDEKPQANPKTHWAFQPLRHVTPPGTGHPIDAFIDRRLNDAGLRRSAPANPVALIRRMYLDLHGISPTPLQNAKQIEQLRNKHTAKIIDQLLESPRYGERWAQHWLDVVRYADTHGYEVNTSRPNAWPYRDYVIRAFNQDKPFNRFVVDQLAGDTVGEDAATGFMVAAAALLPGQIGADAKSKRLARQDELDEIIVGTSATFMGLTVGCARCHDHKFDPIPQTDYYAMQAFFAGVFYGDRVIQQAGAADKELLANKLQPQITALRNRLRQFEPQSFSGRTIIIDDEDLNRVTLLQTKNGHGTNPNGTDRGYGGDVGDGTRFGNLSRSRYTWWDNKNGQDVFTWNPAATGEFRLWISWGVHGSGVHTRDARYVLDADGDLKTKNDQTEIARADQYYFVGQTTGESEKKPLWSGLQDTGVHSFTASTRLILHAGATKTGITADVIVMQAADRSQTKPQLPRLRAPVNSLKNIERFEPVIAKFVRFTIAETTENNRYQPCLDELEVFTSDAATNIALASHGTKASSSGNYANSGKHQLKHINDGKYGNSFSWISNEFGRGWVQLEFAKPATIDRVEWARDREAKFKDRLPVRYQIAISQDGKNWSTVASSEDRVSMGTPHDAVNAMLRNTNGTEQKLSAWVAELRELEKRQAKLRQPQMVFAGRFQKPTATFLLNRGDPEQPTDEISPRVLSTIGSLELPKNASDSQRRVALANWIASKENPLTARVIVNRVWQYHFGIGLVETPSDFGLNGSQPSHPELLDWLTGEFIKHGWSIKHLHRLIMSSATYQQASVQRATTGEDAANVVEPKLVDSGNRLLWHFASRRLEAEAIRDSILFASGQLNLKMGGPGFDFFKTRGGLSGFPPVEKFTANEFRRMIYAHKVRMEPVPVFGAFDCPDAGLPTPRRSQSTTAIQALNLFNSPFVIDQADQFAKRVMQEAPGSVAEQIDLTFQIALGRLPDAHERNVVADSVKLHGLSTLCRALFNSSEFLFIP